MSNELYKYSLMYEASGVGDTLFEDSRLRLDGDPQTVTFLILYALPLIDHFTHLLIAIVVPYLLLLCQRAPHINSMSGSDLSYRSPLQARRRPMYHLSMTPTFINEYGNATQKIGG